MVDEISMPSINETGDARDESANRGTSRLKLEKRPEDPDVARGGSGA